MLVGFLDRHSRLPGEGLAADHPPHIPVAECLHALEPRHMFDAAGVSTGAEAAVDAVAQEQAEQAVDNHGNDSGAADAGQASDASSADNADANEQLLEALATHQPPAGRREIVFIDTSVEDYQKLIAGIDPSAEVVLLDATRDGVEQIAEALAGRSGIDAIHIVSHGSQAELRLGTARLTLDSMTGRYVDELAVLGQALTDEADLLVYGCDFGQGQLGQEAATTLARITGADVAASEDATGHTTLGGDWDLEFRAGSVETTAVLSFEAQANFMGLLAPPGIDLDANNSSGTSGVDYSAQYPAAGDSLSITDIDARLADADSATLSSLTVTTTNLLDGANENLSADTTGTAITASYNSGTGVLTLSGADTVGNYQRVLRTITYANAALAPDRTDRLITFVANDGAGDSNVGTATVYWNYVRDDFAPAAYDGNDGSDSWSTDWQEIGESNGPASGRVQVVSGSLEISTLLAGLGMRGAAREVNLSGASSAVLSFNYQRSSGLISSSQAFAEVSNNGGGSWFRLATYDLNSSDATPIAQQFDLTPYISSQTQIRFASNTLSLELLASSISFDDIDISYDAHGSTPILDLDSGAPGANFATTFTEGAGPVVVADTDAVVTDADSPMLTELVATIVNPQDGAAESLAANTGATGITASYDPATATLTLSGNDTVANYQQVLRTITYDNTSQSPNTTARTITFQASDGIDHSNVALATVTVNAVNDPPVVATTGSALAYTENDPATAVDSGLTVSDVDNTTLTGATVTLSANYVNGEDVLGFTDQLGITGSWNAVTGTLTLSGTTILANYQAALRTIVYTNLSDGPSTLARTVSFVVNDGSANSVVATRTLNITAVNDAPVITSNGGGATASVNVAENTTAVTTVTSSDVDGAAPTYSLTGGADQGLFSINPSTGALSFNTVPDFEAPADAGANNLYDVTVQVSDGNGGTDMQAIAVTITDFNEPPVVNDQAFSVAENTANGTPVGTVIASDVDAGDTRSFSITAGNTAGAFAIDTATGQITVANAAALDFETNPSFTLTVQV
ncbi:MAG: DUF4347 domain-containing protein, partial [Gammaproteobacteria bacterium]